LKQRLSKLRTIMSPAHYVVEIIGGEGTKSLLAAATKCFVPWPGQINHWPDHVPDVSHASTRHGPSTHAHAALGAGAIVEASFGVRRY